MILFSIISTWIQLRRYPLDLMDKSRGGKLLGAANCDNILNEQSQSHQFILRLKRTKPKLI